MKYGLNLPPFADFSDPRTLARTAHEAEEAGWDGFFIWDHIIFDPSWHPIGDTWVGLAAVAMATSRVRFGPMLTPLPRRRPWKLAREAISVDQISNGRLILSVGIGDPVLWEFGFFGEETDARIRARRLDEGLEVLTGLWSGRPFSFTGEHYRLQEMRFVPTPVQSPRIPIWVGGNWPNKPPIRRAARWDGVCPIGQNGPLTPETWREIRAYIDRYRTDDHPFDLVHAGASSGEDRSAASATVAPFAEAGVTWWIEDVSPWRFGLDWEVPWTPWATTQMLDRIHQGPPRP